MMIFYRPLTCSIIKDEATTITVFEHEALYTDRGSKKLTNLELEALQAFYGKHGVEYFKLIHHGVKFKEFVGVLQVGSTTIEVLPKADKNGDTNKWRSVLIRMLKATGIFDIQAPSSSSLQTKANSILDLYFELFIQEMEYLVHKGLIKKYLKHQGNSLSLKGSLHFPKHIQQNLLHQERFFVRYTTYDTKHLLHKILYKCLILIKRININPSLHSRIGSILLHFPEQTDIKIREATFCNINFDRKSEAYRKALEIARLLLLNYHPDLSKGKNHVLAIMFDMNLLWEKFVYVSLRKHAPSGTKISPQSKKSFWKTEKGYKSTIRPDIVVNFEKGKSVVLDTKWKNLYGEKPASDDLRQMYVYNRYFGSKNSALIYPGPNEAPLFGQYYHEDNQALSNNSCSIIPIAVNSNIAEWQSEIYEKVVGWFKV